MAIFIVTIDSFHNQWQKSDIVLNEKALRFETKLDNGEYAYLEYRWYKKDLALMHTFVPKEMEGQGLASALAHYSLEYAKEKKLLIMVYCPFVGSYLKRHPEYNVLVDKQYQ